jgi:hypothetical protein
MRAKAVRGSGTAVVKSEPLSNKLLRKRVFALIEITLIQDFMFNIKGTK